MFHKFIVDEKMVGKFSYDNRNLLLFSCGLAVLLSYFSSYTLLLLALIIIVTIAYYNGNRILLLLIILGYLSAPSEYFGGMRVYINLIGSGLLIFLFIKEFGIQFEKYPKIPKQVIFFLIALFFSLFVSTIFSSDPKTGFFTIITMFAFFIITYMFYSFLENEQNIYIYIYSIYAVVLIFSIRMFLDLYVLGFQDFLIKGMLNENIKLYGSALYTGRIVFFVSITFITAMFFMDKFKTGINRFILSFSFIMNVVVLVLTNSRGGIIAAFLSISFLLLLLRKSLFIKIFIIIPVILAVLFFTVPAINENVNLYLRWEQVSSREVFWQSGIDIIEDYPFFGIGPNLFPKIFSNYAPSYIYSKISAERLIAPTPHNFFLYFTAENGILGLLISVSFFILFFYIAVKTVRLTKKMNNDYFILSSAITGIGAGLFVRSFIESNGFLFYGNITSDLPFWLIYGILISIYQKSKITNR